MTDSAERVGHYFDKNASKYDDNMRSWGWLGTAALSQALGRWPKPVASALDLGTGTGAALEAVVEQKDPQHIVTVDTSQGMLDRLREKYADLRIHIAKRAISDYLATTKDTFDLATAMAVMHFIPNPGSIIEGVASRLNVGGRFMFTYDPIVIGDSVQSWPEISVPGEDFSIYRQHPGEMQNIVQEKGLSIISNQLFRPKPAGTPEYVSGFIVAEKIQ